MIYTPITFIVISWHNVLINNNNTLIFEKKMWEMSFSCCFKNRVLLEDTVHECDKQKLTASFFISRRILPLLLLRAPDLSNSA